MTGRLKFLKEKGKTVAKMSFAGMTEKEMLAFIKRHEKEIMKRLNDDAKNKRH